MINVVVKSNCCGCGACAQICLKGCISLQPDGEGFLYPAVDAAACVECGLCERVCPILQSGKTDAQEPIDVFAAFGKDEKIRERSSSGGIFSLLAEWVLAQGGVVFGAAFEADFSVRHVRIDTIDALDKLRGSKYVQSRTENTYQEAKLALEQGRKVLYSGVGCQVTGLKCFLGKEYENLLTVDVICHGVPSPKVWQKYLQCCEEKRNSCLTKVSFRNKRQGWHNYETEQCFQNGQIQRFAHGKDPYIKMFLSEICLRPSCHSCHFRKGKSGADLTLGDAWGIEKWMPEMDDDRGTSVVFVNSPKGQMLWNEVQTQTVSKQADLAIVVKNNSSYEKSVKPHPSRMRFFRALNKGASLEALVRLTKEPLWKRGINFVKRCAKKLLKK